MVRNLDNERFEKEKDLIGYCGLYCRLCDYYTGEIRNVARRALEMIEKHAELEIFAKVSGEFSYEELKRGLRWIVNNLTPCIGACRGGGGWDDCPLRKCCIERGVAFCYECSDFPCDIIKRELL